MAKDYKHASFICGCITVLAVLGIAIGIWKDMPMVIAILMLPAVLYEIYRTEGVFTIAASWMSLFVLIAAIYLIYNHTTIDIAPFINKFIKIPMSQKAMHAGLIAPVVLVVLSVFLFRMTAGIYTRWLAAIILVSSIALFYSIDSSFMTSLLQSSEVQHHIKEGVKKRDTKYTLSYFDGNKRALNVLQYRM